MRLYAVVLPPRHDVERLFEHLGAHPGDASLMWDPVEAVRIGLCYFGSLTQTDAHRLAARLAVKASELESLPLRFSGGGALEEEGDNTVWAGLRGDLDQLSALASAMAETARVEGLMVDRRWYRPRASVARINAITTAPRLQMTLDRLSQYDGDPWHVSHITLIEPHLSSEPVSSQLFNIVEALPLTGQPKASETGGLDEPPSRSDTSHVPQPPREQRRK